MPARPHSKPCPTKDMMMASVWVLVLLTFLLASAPGRAGDPNPAREAGRADDVARSLEQLSGGRVTTLDQLVAETAWRKRAAARLSAAVAAFEAAAAASALPSDQTAQKSTRAQ